MRKVTRLVALVASVVLMAGSAALAQDQGGGGAGRQGGGRGGWDPEQMRQRMNDRMKEALGVNDEEWKALQPKLEKVQQLQRDQMMGGGRMMFMGGRRGGQGGQGGQGGPGGAWQQRQAETPVGKAQQELQTTLDNKDATPEQITQKLTALREAREKAKADLAQAQKELRELLTQRQEATLVLMGTLE